MWAMKKNASESRSTSAAYGAMRESFMVVLPVSARRRRAETPWIYGRSVPEALGDAVDAHLRAHRVLVAAGCARDADRAHDLVAGADQQRAFGGGDIGEHQRGVRRRRAGDALAEVARIRLE